jgi:hypothetical protein
VHTFQIKIDGTGFVDLTPATSTSGSFFNITNDKKILGNYQTSDQKWHGIIYPDQTG